MSTSQGVKILGKDLEKTLAGLPLLVAHRDDEVPVLRVRQRPLTLTNTGFSFGFCCFFDL